MGPFEKVRQSDEEKDLVALVQRLMKVGCTMLEEAGCMMLEGVGRAMLEEVGRAMLEEVG